MSLSERKGNPSKYVTLAQCARQVAEFNGELKIMKKALVGEDMRGGLVKDVQEIKTATSWVKTILVPIVTSVAAAIITYLVLHGC